MRVVCREQQTAEWFAAKVGKIGASNIHKAMAFLKRASGDRKAGESSKERDKYIRELATELITRVPMEHYVSPAMDHGTQYESEARIEYWMTTGVEVEQAGFILHPKIDFAGASPDGLINPNGGCEIKCPMLHTHMEYLATEEIPEEYRFQIYWNMMCCEAEWWDFVSYVPPAVYPEVPEKFRLYIKRVTRAEAQLDSLLKFRVGDAEYQGFDALEHGCIKTMDEAARLVITLDGRCKERVPKPQPVTSGAEIKATDDEWAFLDSHDLTP